MFTDTEHHATAIRRGGRRARNTARRALRRALVVGVGALAVAGCGSPPNPDRFYTPRELSDLASGRTMQIGDAYGSRFRLLIYLAPDGTGWLDTQVDARQPPRPGTMSMLSNWYVAIGSQVCAWASPLIGDMPSFVPARLACVQVLRPAVPGAGATAVVWWNGRYQALPIEFFPMNIFPDAVIEQYRLQVRVLYGGQIPSW
jgi:hypothetical protein